VRFNAKIAMNELSDYMPLKHFLQSIAKIDFQCAKYAGGGGPYPRLFDFNATAGQLTRFLS